MTNNPTIDGVRLLPCPFCGDPGRTDNGFGLCESIHYAWCTNQDCFMSDGVDMGVTSEDWNRRDPHALPRHSKRLIEQQQSTIAQLQARVAELEIGTGESVGWQFFDKGEWHTGLKVNDHRKNTEEAGYPVRDVYAAPPAPVAVVLPERMEYDGTAGGMWEADIWNACLDATAALNGERG